MYSLESKFQNYFVAQFLQQKAQGVFLKYFLFNYPGSKIFPYSRLYTIYYIPIQNYVLMLVFGLVKKCKGIFTFTIR